MSEDWTPVQKIWEEIRWLEAENEVVTSLRDRLAHAVHREIAFTEQQKQALLRVENSQFGDRDLSVQTSTDDDPEVFQLKKKLAAVMRENTDRKKDLVSLKDNLLASVMPRAVASSSSSFRSLQNPPPSSGPPLDRFTRIAGPELEEAQRQSDALHADEDSVHAELTQDLIRANIRWAEAEAAVEEWKKKCIDAQRLLTLESTEGPGGTGGLAEKIRVLEASLKSATEKVASLEATVAELHEERQLTRHVLDKYHDDVEVLNHDLSRHNTADSLVKSVVDDWYRD
eukprot:gnl/Spiro4/24258_TR12040_c0_g1_i1.p1 gnl/Spiro4/24258_TR12040_c0_g1~~gnl/Spiro4/24258_TR12040_c0_g1_i1.p1  ORF type:complete len:285 (+),score=55.51 gnl/Spiro4/24258_TR12040_c0_g1_i1:165-1019(+)